jgi:hypothetical protein
MQGSSQFASAQARGFRAARAGIALAMGRTMRSMTAIPLLLFPLLAATSACATEGFRAETGQCPLDETCSDETPEGLLFYGAGLAGSFLSTDAGIKTLATGGTQTIEVVRNATSSDLGPFDAATEGAGWSVAETAPPEVVVAGDKQGAGILRILDPATGELFDAVDVLALDADGATAHANSFPFVEARPWALMTGAAREVYVALSAGDERLVDQSMLLEADDATEVSQIGWDRLALRRDEAGIATVHATLGSGAVHDLAVAFVGAIDALAVSEGTEPQPIEVGHAAIVCFEGRAGDTAVRGVELTYRTEGAAIELSEGTELWLGCPVVEGIEPGTARLIAEGHGRSHELDIEVVPADDDRRAAAEGGLPRATPGARARR